MQKVGQHLMDFLTNHLSSEDKAYLWFVGAPGPHRGLPEWVHLQVYLHPYPKELMLRNHV
jgi:hypothetical protein